MKMLFKTVAFPFRVVWFLVKLPFRILGWILGSVFRELSNVKVSSKRFGS